MDDTKTGGEVGALFALFTEIGIIAQLSGALFQARLQDGVTVAQFGVLNHLIRVGDGATPLALARAFQTPKTSMTHSLSALEARGLIDMRPNPDDGRSKCVWLTQAGRDFRDAAIQTLAGDMKEIADEIDMDAALSVLPELTRLRQVLDRMRD